MQSSRELPTGLFNHSAPDPCSLHFPVWGKFLEQGSRVISALSVAVLAVFCVFHFISTQIIEKAHDHPSRPNQSKELNVLGEP
jgi:hypothetical protein